MPFSCAAAPAVNLRTRWRGRVWRGTRPHQRTRRLNTDSSARTNKSAKKHVRLIVFLMSSCRWPPPPPLHAPLRTRRCRRRRPCQTPCMFPSSGSLPLLSSQACRPGSVSCHIHQRRRQRRDKRRQRQKQGQRQQRRHRQRQWQRQMQQQQQEVRQQQQHQGTSSNLSAAAVKRWQLHPCRWLRVCPFNAFAAKGGQVTNRPRGILSLGQGVS